MRVITLTTDFGPSDWFVGSMKGVILGLNSRVQIADISHAIAAGDVRAGAFVLAASYAAFPKGTIHVVVVDPGVGGDRNAIAVETENYIFIGPDNGVLSLAVGREATRAIHRLENRRYFRKIVSSTFHGRDVFAPVAAHISRGVAVARLGRGTQDFVKLNLPKPRAARNSIIGEVIYIDAFGNAITNIESELLQNGFGPDVRIRVSPKRILTFRKYYEEVQSGSPLGLINSAGLLEIAVNRGCAAGRLRLKVGSPVAVFPAAK